MYNAILTLCLSEGILSYEMLQGHPRGTILDLLDSIYDGHKEEQYLYGGLGQLTDGMGGETSFHKDNKG